MVTVNGRARELPAGVVLAQVVADLLGRPPATAGGAASGGWPATGGGGPVRGIAVAVNGEVVPRASWAGTVLRDGDRIEVLTAAQGG